MAKNSILITGGKICDPSVSEETFFADILLDDGIITLNPSETKNAEVFNAEGCIITPGLFDLRCNFQDPGYEHKEDLMTGAEAAEYGGFTGVALQPNTSPILQNKSQIRYILQQTSDSILEFFPIAAATQDFQSVNITEMYDLQQAGAVAFSNGNHSFVSSDGLLRALEYGKTINALVMTHAVDTALASKGIVNESENTIITGLKQQPALAEFVQVKKELEIAKYAEAPIHFSHISTKESVELIRQAKTSGQRVTCDVCIWHLIYSDREIERFDPNFKLCPPLRTEKDVKSLIEAVKDGTIDAIVSDHLPQNEELKKVEFDYADFGAIGIQTLYSMYSMHLADQIDLITFIKACSVLPREILGLPLANIKDGNRANLSIFNPQEEWEFNGKSNKSKSANSPIFNTKIVGRCVAIARGDKFKRIQ